jgi:hypothetical protein
MIHHNQRFTLVNVYAPQRTDSSQHEFFDTLVCKINENSWHDATVLVGGDLNCDGAVLFDQLNLVSSATHLDRLNWTWKHRHYKSTIDFIALPRSLRHHFRRHNFVQGLKSDHRMIVVDISRISPFARWTRKVKRVPLGDMSPLAYDQVARENFGRDWSQRERATNLSELASKLADCRKQLPPRVEPKKKATWLSERTKMLLTTHALATEESSILNVIEREDVSEVTRLIESFTRELRGRYLDLP